MERRPVHQTPEAPRAGDHDIESESKRPRSPPSPVLASIGVGNKLALASVGVLFVWTALLCLGAYLFGVNFGQTAVLPPPRRPQGLSSGPSRSLLGAETDEVERRWTDKLIGDQLCASSSNRNFKGRQGSPTGRTLLMSPVMVAAAAVSGKVADAREVFAIQS